MADDYDPNAIYKDVIHSANELDSPATRSALSAAQAGPNLDFTRPLGNKHISHEELAEIADNCSTPMDSLSQDQKYSIMEFQERMGVGQARSRIRVSTRTYHYYK
jgi:hypothetical protein